MAYSNDADKKFSLMHILNHSFYRLRNILTVAVAGETGQGMGLNNAENMAMKVTVSGEYTYIGVAAPGTDQASALWQCKRIHESGGTTTITWSDGDTKFDNVATDLTALTYS